MVHIDRIAVECNVQAILWQESARKVPVKANETGSSTVKRVFKPYSVYRWLQRTSAV